MKIIEAAAKELTIRAARLLEVASTLAGLVEGERVERQPKRKHGKRTLSAAGRRSIKQAQKARWAAWRKKNGVKAA